MKKTLTALSILSFCSANAFAYQGELSIGISQSQNTQSETYNFYSASTEETNTGKTLEFSFFDKPLTTVNGPRAEQAFLNQASSVSLLYQRGKETLEASGSFSGQFWSQTSVLVESKVVDAKGQFFLTPNGLTLEMRYNSTDYGYEADFVGRTIGFGYYFSEDFAATFSAGTGKGQFLFYSNIDANILSLSVKKIARFRKGMSLGITAEANQLKADEFNNFVGYTIDVSAIFYPTERLGLGLLATNNTGDSYVAPRRGATASYFLTDAIYFGSSYSIDEPQYGDSVKLFEIEGAYRF